jgi:triacylglycerol lipase
VLSDSAGRRETMQRATSSQHPMFSAPASSLAAERELLGAVFSDPSWQTPEALKAGMAWSMAKGDAWTIRSFQDPRIVREALTDADLKAITIPTLVVWGEHDKLIPIADGRWLASRVRGAQFRIVNGSGHAPMIEKPTAFLEAVAGFVQ